MLARHAHQLVSRFTSLIAVDVTPERPLSEGLARGSVASLMPAGSAAPAGMLPVTATSARQLRMLGALCWCACLVLLGLRGSTR